MAIQSKNLWTKCKDLNQEPKHEKYLGTKVYSEYNCNAYSGTQLLF